MPMAVLILVALLVPAALVYVGVLGWAAGVVATFAVLFLAAWNFDRGRRLGARDPIWDANRPDMAAPLDSDRQIPTEAVQSPSDRGFKD